MSLNKFTSEDQKKEWMRINCAYCDATELFKNGVPVSTATFKPYGIFSSVAPDGQCTTDNPTNIAGSSQNAQYQFTLGNLALTENYGQSVAIQLFDVGDYGWSLEINITVIALAGSACVLNLNFILYSQHVHISGTSFNNVTQQSIFQSTQNISGGLELVLYAQWFNTTGFENLLRKQCTLTRTY